MKFIKYIGIMLFVLSIQLSFTTPVLAEKVSQNCTLETNENTSIKALGDTQVVNEKNVATTCKNKLNVKRTFELNPSNIDGYLATENLETKGNRELEQICLNIFTSSVEIEAVGSTVDYSTRIKYKCKLTFKETNVFKIAKGDKNYLNKVAEFFNSKVSLKTTIIAGADTNIDTVLNADQSNVSKETRINTTSITKVEVKNIIKLWNGINFATKQYFKSLIAPSSVLNSACFSTGQVNNLVNAVNKGKPKVVNTSDVRCNNEYSFEVLYR
ncbi:MAG: hypothetical protein ACRCXZ_05695 [Patescibacteria group bacterium]